MRANLDRFNVTKRRVLEADKAAARARQRDYLNSLGPDDYTRANLLKANDIVPTDPPVLTAEGALRLGAFLRPETDPVLPIAWHRRLLGRIGRL